MCVSKWGSSISAEIVVTFHTWFNILFQVSFLEAQIAYRTWPTIVDRINEAYLNNQY